MRNLQLKICGVNLKIKAILVVKKKSMKIIMKKWQLEKEKEKFCLLKAHHSFVKMENFNLKNSLQL